MSPSCLFPNTEKLPILMQTEPAECGLLCVAMIAHFYGNRLHPSILRSKFPVSLRGATLADLMRIADKLQLQNRAITIDLPDLTSVRLPCILHWRYTHFVVLKKVGKHEAIIHDPAAGVKRVTREELSSAFTGVALELWPAAQFEQVEPRPRVRISDLIGKTIGVGSSAAVVLGLALLAELCIIANPLFMQWVLDKVLVSNDRQLLAVLACGFAIVLLIQQFATFGRSWALIYFGSTVSFQWRANLFQHLLRLPIDFFQRRHLGDIVSKFGSIDQIQRTLSTSFVEGFLDGIMALTMLVMMYFYSPVLSSLVLTVMAIYIIIRCIWYKPLRNSTERQIVFAATQQTHFIESLRGIRTIKLFSQENIRRNIWLGLIVEQVNNDVKTQRLQLGYRTTNGVLFGCENLLVISIAANAVLELSLSVGTLIAFMAYKGQFEARVTALIDKVFELRMLRIYNERLADIAFAAEEEIDGNHGVSPANLDPKIEAVNVSYSYGVDSPVLQNVNFVIDAGESVALIGPSGCGKTTLINIILGILPMTSGDVLIGGKSIKQIGASSVRSMIGTVMQDDVLFAGTIIENISFFDTTPDTKWVRECAEIAMVLEEIDSMPMGFNTMVGDMGTALSGGQKQRILMARALYKRPKILVMDEATSHLDILCERAVNGQINKLKMTRLVVAHRPETIASADRIIAMHSGTIVQTSINRKLTEPSREAYVFAKV